MARNTSVTLGDYFDEFVEELVREGRFQSVSEVVRAGLRRLEKDERRERLLERLDDIELARMVEERKGQKEIPVDFDDL